MSNRLEELQSQCKKYHLKRFMKFTGIMLFLLTGVGILFVPATIFLSIIFWVAAVSILGWSIAMIPKS